MKNENGFDFLDFPCASGKPDSLVLVFHGHANHPDMFVPLADKIRKDWPNADVLIIKAPVPLHADQKQKEHHGAGHVDDLYTWHKIDKDAVNNIKLVFNHAVNRLPIVNQLNKFADAQLEKRGLSDDALALFGFSMGGAIAVQMATRRDKPCAAVVNHSGPVFPVFRPKARPDTLMLTGEKDHLFYTGPAVAKLPPKGKLKKAMQKALSRISLGFNDSVDSLKDAGIPVSSKVVPDLGHTISPESFQLAMDFIAKKFKPGS